MSKVSELREFQGAGTHAERAAVLLVARPVILLKFANEFIATSERVGFHDGITFVVAFLEAQRAPMQIGCMFSPGYEEARMVLRGWAR